MVGSIRESLEVENVRQVRAPGESWAGSFATAVSFRRSVHLAQRLTSQINLEPEELLGEQPAGDEASPGLSTAEAIVTLMAAMIGSGVMALPQLPAKGGALLSVVVCVVCGLSTIESGLVFCDALALHNEQAKGDASKKILHTFEDFGKAAAGRAGGVLIRTCVTFWFIGLCSGYVIILAQQLDGLLEGTYGYLGYQHSVALLAPVLWLLAMQRDVVGISSLMPIATLGGLVSCVLIVGMSLWDSQLWKNWPKEEKILIHNILPPPNTTFMTIGTICATISGAYAVIGNVPSIFAGMGDKREFPRVFVISISLTTTLFASVMLAGHYGYGNFVQSSIVDSMEYNPRNANEAFHMNPKDWTGERGTYKRVCPRVMCICVIANIILSYPLCLICVFGSVQCTNFGQKHLQVGTTMNCVMRTVIVGMTVLVAYSTQEFGIVFALVASVLGPLQCVFFVFVFAARIRQKAGAAEYPAWRKAVHLLLMLTGIFCMVFGFIDSARSLMGTQQAAGGTPGPAASPAGGPQTA